MTATTGGFLVVTRLKIFLATSLVFCWWIASILPHYQPMIQAHFKTRLDEARKRIPAIKVDWATPEDYDPRSAYNVSKVALLIEPRVMPHLVPQILHMISVIPPDWRFLFIGSEKSAISLGRAYATKHQQVIGKLDIMVMPEPWEIDSKEHVYRMLTDMRFYDEFLPDVEWILKYESDSILCANSPQSLNDWLHWDWAGAPKSKDDRFSGNGGLSIRRVSVIRKVLGFQARYNDSDPEDEWFGKRIYIMPGAKVASGTDGVLTVEDVYVENAMGYHVRDGGAKLAPDVWEDPAQRKKIFDYCPELSMIMDMKLERERCKGDDLKGVIHPTPEEKKQEDEDKKKKQEEERKKKQEEKKKQQEEAEEKKKEEENEKKKAEDEKKEEDEEKKEQDEEKKEEDEEKKQEEEEEIEEGEEEEKERSDEEAQKEAESEESQATERDEAAPES